MSNEKLEALMWRATSLGLRWGAEAHEYGSMREEYAEGWARMHNGQIAASCAIGVEEGKREAAEALHWKGVHCMRVENELAEAKRELQRLREAAPVDDGRRFEMFVCTRAGDRIRSANYPDTYPASDVATILAADSLAHETCRGCYEARPVEPKHVHVWTEWEDAGDKLGRACKTCPSKQVAEWKDES